MTGRSSRSISSKRVPCALLRGCGVGGIARRAARRPTAEGGSSGPWSFEGSGTRGGVFGSSNLVLCALGWLSSFSFLFFPFFFMRLLFSIFLSLFFCYSALNLGGTWTVCLNFFVLVGLGLPHTSPLLVVSSCRLHGRYARCGVFIQ